MRTVPAKRGEDGHGHGHGDDGVEEGADGVEEGAQSKLPSTAPRCVFNSARLLTRSIDFFNTRKAFSEVDDKLLIKFIALNIPSEGGRSGNKPYQMLTENVRPDYNLTTLSLVDIHGFRLTDCGHGHLAIPGILGENDTRIRKKASISRFATIRKLTAST